MTARKKDLTPCGGYGKMNQMKSEGTQQKGIVVESYNHDPLHRVVTVCLQDNIKSYFFFFVPEVPAVELGDIFLMNFYADKYYIRRGNDRLTFKITPTIFPGDLLLELISERLNQ